MSEAITNNADPNATTSTTRRANSPLVQTMLILFVAVFLANLFLKPFIARHLPTPPPQLHPALKAFLGANGLLSVLLAICTTTAAFALSNGITRLRQQSKNRATNSAHDQSSAGLPPD